MLEPTIKLNNITFRSISDVRGEHVRQDVLSSPLRRTQFVSRYAEDPKTMVIRNNLTYRSVADVVGGAPTGVAALSPVTVSLSIVTNMYHVQMAVDNEVQRGVGAIVAYLTGIHDAGLVEAILSAVPTNLQLPLVGGELLAAIRRGEQ